MKVYELTADIELLHLTPVASETDPEVVMDLVRVTGRQKVWNPSRIVPVRVVEWAGRGSYVLVDFAYFDHLSPLLLSPYAQEALAPVLDGRGYFADTDFVVDDGVYRLFFPTRRVDAIDLENSVLRRFKDGGVWDVVKHELRQDALEAETIMTLEHRRSFIFVSDEFVDVLNQAELTGYTLRQIWSSEEGGVDLRLIEHPPGKPPKEMRRLQLQRQKQVRKFIEGRAARIAAKLRQEVR